MRILVTGAAGYVGHQIAGRLAGAGHDVVGTSRRPLELPGVEVAVGDHLDSEFVARVVSGSEAVLHFAARTRGHDAAVFQRDNEDMTRLFCQAARRLERRLIFISSDQAVYQTGFYGRSKRACEAIVADTGGEQAIVRLTAVLGRYAPEMASTFSRIIQKLERLPALPVPGNGELPIAPIWIGDIELVMARLLAIEQLPAEPLELCGDELTLRGLIDLFEARLGVRRLRLPIPIRPLQAVARLLKPHQMFARLPLDALLDLGSPIGVSYQRLAELIGFAPTSMESAVAQIEGFPG